MQLRAGEKLVLDTSFSETSVSLALRGSQKLVMPFYPGHGAYQPVALRPGDVKNGNFAASPTDSDLSDCKSVAPTRTHAASPPIFNATTTDWHKDYPPLTHNGVRIELLCPESMTKPRR